MKVYGCSTNAISYSRFCNNGGNEQYTLLVYQPVAYIKSSIGAVMKGRQKPSFFLLGLDIRNETRKQKQG